MSLLCMDFMFQNIILATDPLVGLLAKDHSSYSLH